MTTQRQFDVADYPTLPSDFIFDIYDQNLQFRSLTAYELKAVPDTSVLEAEQALNICIGLLETHQPIQDELKNALEKDSQLSLDYKNFVRRLDKKETSVVNSEYTDLLTTLNYVRYRNAARDKGRELNIAITDIKSQKRKAEQRLGIFRTRTQTPASSPQVSPSFKLPEVHIPFFSGDVMEFESFWELFTTLVDKTSVPEVYKFSFLKTKLKGEPFKLVGKLSSTTDNYAVAKSLLVKKYGRKEAILAKLRSQFFNIGNVRTKEEVREMFYDAESTIQQIEQISGKKYDSEEVLLFLQKKLPNYYLERVIRERETIPDWNLSTFRDLMPKLISQDELLSDLKDSEKHKEPVPDFDKIQKRLDNLKKNLPVLRKDAPVTFTGIQKRTNANYSNNFKPKYPIVTSSSPIKKTIVPWNNTPCKCLFCDSTGHPPHVCPLSKVERKQKLLNDRRCLKCMKPGHFANSCNSEVCRTCGGHHHTFVCTKINRSNANLVPISSKRQPLNLNATPTAQAPTAPKQNDSTWETNVTSTGVVQNTVLMMCKVVQANNPLTGHSDNAVIFIDIGSDLTFVTSRLAQTLQLEPEEPKRVEVTRAGEDGAQGGWVVDGNYVTLDLHFKGNKLTIRAVQLPDNIPFLPPLRYAEIDGIKPTYNIYTDTITFPKTFYEKPDILLGLDHANQLQMNFSHQLPNGLGVYETTLGKFVCGKEEMDCSKAFTSTLTTSAPVAEEEETASNDEVEEAQKLSTTDQDGESLIKKFLAYESAGFSPTEENLKEDEEVLKYFKETVDYAPNPSATMDEPPGRYVVRLPWKNNDTVPAQNYGVAFVRFRNTLKKLREKPELLKQYHEIMMEQIRLGIMEKVQNPLSYTGNLYYMPHQAVIKESSSTTKLRVVYDASSGNPSLNDCLYKGKVYAGQHEQSISALFCRISLMPHVLTMDLEKAFLQIVLHQNDRDANRLLWNTDPQNLDTPEIYRFARVSFGVSSSPFLLGATVEHHLQKYNTDLSKKLMRGSYVDNYIVSLDQPYQLQSVVEEAREMFWKGGFNCRQFSSDCRDELSTLPIEWQETKSQLSLLGIQWNTISDEWIFEMPKPPEKVTKRNILSTIASLFDPNGWCSPIMLSAKKFQARVWKLGLKWDEELNPLLRQEWFSIADKWRDRQITIPRRCIKHKNTRSLQLHGFSDASDTGLGLTIYVRTNNDNNADVGLLFARSLVVPTALQPKKTKTKPEARPISIPRLELQALMLLSKAIKQVKEVLLEEVNDVILWTDSATAVHWLINGTHNETFVKNRIKTLSEFDVRFIPREYNPADMATKGCVPEALQDNHLWFHGPPWLIQPEIDWPVTLRYDPNNHEKENVESSESNRCITAISKPVEGELIEVERFSSLLRLKRTLVRVLRFLRNRIWDHPNQSISTINLVHKYLNKILEFWKPITADELDIAELLLIRQAQKVYPPDESTRAHLRIFEDTSGLLRCQGRFPPDLQLPEETKFPLYLSRDSYISILLIREIHLKNHHCGPATLVTMYRQRYWTPSLRRHVRNVLYHEEKLKCVSCYRFVAKPCHEPAEPIIPTERVAIKPPFTFCGTDFFGPFNVKTESGETIKNYGIIFACLSTRAIHLEVCTDMTTDRYLLAFRRFAARRGMPNFILSDNARQFTLAGQIIAKNWIEINEDPKWNDFMASNGILWEYITPRAPWRGSAYERMIGLVKQSMKRTLGQKLLSGEELYTTMTEIENIVNSRPLSTVIEDDMYSLLRPIDFLRPLTSDPYDEYRDRGEGEEWLPPEEQARMKLIRMYQQLLNRLDHSWKIFKQEYLTGLRERWSGKEQEGKKPFVGQVVIVHDEETPRSKWDTAVITSLESNRTAKIRYVPYKAHPHPVRLLPLGSTTKRALRHLYPLELGETPDMENNNVNFGLSQRQIDEWVKSTPRVTLQPWMMEAIGKSNKTVKRTPSKNNETPRTSHKAFTLISFISVCCLFGNFNSMCTTQAIFHKNQVKPNQSEAHRNALLSIYNRHKVNRTENQEVSTWTSYTSATQASPTSTTSQTNIPTNYTSKIRIYSHIVTTTSKPYYQQMLVNNRIRPVNADQNTLSRTAKVTTYTTYATPVTKTSSNSPTSPRITTATEPTTKTSQRFTPKHFYWINRNQPPPKDPSPAQYYRPKTFQNKMQSTVPSSIRTSTEKTIQITKRHLDPNKEYLQEDLEILNQYQRVLKRGGKEHVRLHPDELKKEDNLEKVMKSTKYFSFCKSKGSFLLRVPRDHALCSAPLSPIENWKTITVGIFTKISEPIPIPSTHCARSTKSFEYYTNLLGDAMHTDPVLIIEPVNPSVCREANTTKKTAEGPLFEERQGFFSTAHTIKATFPGRLRSFFFGSETAATTNFLLDQTELFLSPSTHKLTSPNHELRDCHFWMSNCTTNNATFIWETPWCNHVGCKPCLYKKSRAIQGYTDGRTFISSDHHFVISFPKIVTSINDCKGYKLFISDQGLAINEDDYERMISQPRGRREVATTEELASQLSAEELNNIEMLRKVMKLVCNITKPMEVDPTLLVQQMFGTQGVAAKWRTPDLIQVFHCATIPNHDIYLRNTSECFLYLPVWIKAPDLGLIRAFLDTRLQILSQSSLTSDCKVYDRHYIDLGDNVLEIQYINKITMKLIPEVDVHHLPDQPSFENSFPFSTFHDFILSNDTEMLEEIHNAEHPDEMERTFERPREWDVVLRQTSKALSATPHSVGGILKSYLFGWLGIFHSIWINVCAAFTTLIMLFIFGFCCLPRCLTEPARKASGVLWKRIRKKRKFGRILKGKKNKGTKRVDFEDSLGDIAMQVFQKLTQDVNNNDEQEEDDVSFASSNKPSTSTSPVVTPISALKNKKTNPKPLSKPRIMKKDNMKRPQTSIKELLASKSTTVDRVASIRSRIDGLGSADSSLRSSIRRMRRPSILDRW